MNVVDSSGWLEYLAGGPNAAFFAAAVEDAEHLVVPTLSLYEVYKRVAQQRDEGTALRVVSAMQAGEVVDLTATIATAAARLSLQSGLPMADSVMLATARHHGATLWTQDVDFRGLDGVEYVER